jgi:membrane associated rhomboid family serine protease
MIPIRDRNPSGTFPYVTIGIIIVNILIFLYELSLGSGLGEFIMKFGVVPLKVSYYSQVPDLTFINTFFRSFHQCSCTEGLFILSATCGFSGYSVIILRTNWGTLRFIAFYFLCGIIASSVHVFFNIQSKVPCVGASGAIAGVLGAYMITFPHARVVTIVPLFVFIQVMELPAMVVLGFWFVIQFFNGAATITASTSGAGVAWWAHIGGFAAGVIILYIMRIFFAKNP